MKPPKIYQRNRSGSTTPNIEENSQNIGNQINGIDRKQDQEIKNKC